MGNQKDLGREKTSPCKNKSVVYQSTCLICREQGRRVTYTGEIGRGLEERLGDGENQDEKSHIHQLIVAEHPERLEGEVTNTHPTRPT